MAAAVHDTAVVHAGAVLGEGVEVGPFSVIGSEAVIGAGTFVGPHCLVTGNIQLGEGCNLSSHVVLGSAPQDLKYAGEPTSVRIGVRNRFREFVTVNRGTDGGGGETRIGDDNLFMTCAHVGHDCRIGSRTVFANSATLAGHVDVADGVTIGAFSAAHQFCHVGREAFVGGYTVMTKDVLPFVKTVGSRGEVKAYGINSVGLERRGVPGETISHLKSAFRVLRTEKSSDEALARMRELGEGIPEVLELIAFVEASRERRGFHA